MKRTLLTLGASLAFAGAAYAAPVNPDTTACFAEVQTAMATNTIYDGFIPTQFLDDARVIEWKSAYSDANAVPVATVVAIEGEARQRDDRNDTDDVTVKCGIDMGVVKAVEIIPGHDIKMTSPVSASQ